MSEDQKKLLEAQLWGIANLLRGKVSADDYRDYILGFIFYKYLSERQVIYANHLLEGEQVTDYTKVTDAETLEAIKEESLITLGYFLLPHELFSAVAAKGNADKKNESNYILEDLQQVLNHIEQSTMGTESEEDFNSLFDDIDLNSTKLGKTVGARNDLIVQILNYLNKIDFKLDEIAENDYNLNIPRYVDTFEEEDPVDLNVVAGELVKLEKELTNNNDEIAAFCKELNIPTPF
ncbi:MAG TPA: hypothetical protein ENN90_02960 [Mariniphaga anaerophila]|uniref:site-specific DNA-methyltransferase (adenine-specific) n=1 Tax=Mariniphaga anaerophila TaxID=1484053 RepID=A0A831PID2_9BACT|nr:hypothetical protein [Mariniphaga anaerophila]